MICFFILFNSYVFTTKNLEKAHQPVANTKEYSLNDNNVSLTWDYNLVQPQNTILDNSGFQYHLPPLDVTPVYTNAALAYYQSHYNPINRNKINNIHSINDWINFYDKYIDKIKISLEIKYDIENIFTKERVQDKIKLQNCKTLYEHKIYRSEKIINEIFISLDCFLKDVSKFCKTDVSQLIFRLLKLIKNSLFVLERRLSYEFQHFNKSGIENNIFKPFNIIDEIPFNDIIRIIRNTLVTKNNIAFLEINLDNIEKKLREISAL